MIDLEDRRAVACDILNAHLAGARLRLACETAGIDVRTLQRWKAGDGLIGAASLAESPSVIGLPRRIDLHSPRSDRASQDVARHGAFVD